LIHPVCNRDAIGGNETIGREIVEDLPDVDTVIAAAFCCRCGR